MTTPDVLSTLLTFPPGYVDTFSLPLATIFLESRLTREQLLPAIGSGMRVGGWTVSYDAEYDRLNYVRITPLARPRSVSARPVAAAPQRTINVTEVGQKAREHMDAEFAKGIEVTATQAVAHVLGRK